MSALSPKGRIERRQKPPRYYVSYTVYRPYLFEDFGGRCGYSMQHYERAGGKTAMQIDHFNPHLAKHLRNQYENLILATAHCNNCKRDFWPTRAEQQKGIRFLNPCEEQDYGVHLFEDPAIFELWSDTPAGKYHIRFLKLNAPHLIRERQMRHQFRVYTDPKGGILELLAHHGEEGKAREGWRFAREYVDKAIPPIVQKPKPADS